MFIERMLMYSVDVFDMHLITSGNQFSHLLSYLFVFFQKCVVLLVELIRFLFLRFVQFRYFSDKLFGLLHAVNHA